MNANSTALDACLARTAAIHAKLERLQLRNVATTPARGAAARLVLYGGMAKNSSQPLRVSCNCWWSG